MGLVKFAFKDGQHAGLSFGIVVSSRYALNVYNLFIERNVAGDSVTKSYRVPYDGCEEIGVNLICSNTPEYGDKQLYPLVSFDLTQDGQFPIKLEGDYLGEQVARFVIPMFKGKARDELLVTYTLQKNGIAVHIQHVPSGEQGDTFVPFDPSMAALSAELFAAEEEPTAARRNEEKLTKGDGSALTEAQYAFGFNIYDGHGARINHILFKGQKLPAISEKETFYPMFDNQAGIGFSCYRSLANDNDIIILVDDDDGSVKEETNSVQAKRLGQLILPFPKGVSKADYMEVRFTSHIDKVIVHIEYPSMHTPSKDITVYYDGRIE